MATSPGFAPIDGRRRGPKSMESRPESAPPRGPPAGGSPRLQILRSRGPDIGRHLFGPGAGRTLDLGGDEPLEFFEDLGREVWRSTRMPWAGRPSPDCGRAPRGEHREEVRPLPGLTSQQIPRQASRPSRGGLRRRTLRTTRRTRASPRSRGRRRPGLPPTKWVQFRPEIRYDWANHDNFGRLHDKKDQLSLAAEVLLKF